MSGFLSFLVYVAFLLRIYFLIQNRNDKNKMLLQIEEIKKESKENIQKYEAICDEKIDMFKKEVYF